MSGSLIDPEDGESSLHIPRQLPTPLSLLHEEVGLLKGIQHLVTWPPVADTIFTIPLAEALLGQLDMENLFDLQNAFSQREVCPGSEDRPIGDVVDDFPGHLGAVPPPRHLHRVHHEKALVLDVAADGVADHLMLQPDHFGDFHAVIAWPQMKT